LDHKVQELLGDVGVAGGRRVGMGRGRRVEVEKAGTDAGTFDGITSPTLKKRPIIINTAITTKPTHDG